MLTERDQDMAALLMAELNALIRLRVDFGLGIINGIIIGKRQIAVFAAVPAVTDRRRIIAAFCFPFISAKDLLLELDSDAFFEYWTFWRGDNLV